MTLREDGVGLYVHVPFCERRCRFCAFYTHVHRNDDQAAAFVGHLIGEIRSAEKTGIVRSRPVETLYFGGGTPTALSAEQLLAVVAACRESFDLTADIEISIEANPAGVDAEDLGLLRAGGVNRISFGAQSFNDADLEGAGTPHRAESIGRAVRSARAAGFMNVNLDLMYGFPGQTSPHWRANLDQAVALEPDHMSFYGLTLEEGTPFQRDAANGRFELPGNDEMAEFYEIGRIRLAQAGFRQYEVPNFARPGHACRHNLGYWTDREWLGLGPSAHSYLDGVRSSNVASLELYQRMVASGVRPIDEQEPGMPELRAREAVAFGLRTVQGVQLCRLVERYRFDPALRCQESIKKLSLAGWIEFDGNMLRPTRAGLALADELAVAFL